jgi:hypothetical protein
MTTDEKAFYIEAKHWTYTDYTIMARSKEHAIEQFNNGVWDDMESDYGWYDEVITNITEENTEQQLSLPV